MKYKEGDRVRCITPVFEKIFAGCNVWIIDYIKTQVNKPSLYVAYRENDKRKVLYQFFENELVKETRSLEEINNNN